jgi:hypothetical protein
MHNMARPPLIRSLAAIAAGVAISACEAPALLGPQGALSEVVTQVSTGNGTTTATYHDGEAPTGGSSAAPTALATGSTVNGGSALLALSAGSAFTTVVVGVQGMDGYYQLTLPAGAAAADVVLGIAGDASAASLLVQVAVGSASTLSVYAAHDLKIHQVGTGDVQVSVSWSGASDVDLRVMDPSGDLVYFGNPASASGGALDLDSNAGCTLDNVNSENIVWPAGHAPHGDYKVMLAYHDDCGAPRSDYVVTVSMAGHTPSVTTGSFVGSWENNSDVAIGTFTY